LGRTVLAEDDTGRAVVVEALRVADVLEADSKSGAAADTFPAGRVPCSARESDDVAWELFRLRQRDRRRPANDLTCRQRAHHDLARRQRSTRLERVQETKLDRVDVERGSEPVHLRLCGEAGLDGAEAAHRAARRVVRVD